MLASLPAGEFERHVVVPDEPPLRAELEAAGARIHVVPMRRITTSGGFAYWLAYALQWPVVVARLVRLVRRLGIDVVHSNSLHSWYGWAAAWLTRRPHVWSAREIVVQSRAALTVERFLTRHFATIVVAISAAVARQLDARDVRIFFEPVAPRHATSGRFRTNPDEIIFGAAGRIDTWKGFDVLLDAWDEAKLDARLLIAGGPVAGKEDYAAQLRDRAAACFVGPLDDLASFYADLDVFVLPSTEPEPLGLVMLEALAAGVPVIATDHGGPPEILAGHPERGRLVPPNDAHALAEAMREIAKRRTSDEPLYVGPPAPWAAVFREAR
jgi:glycosyltransferase involved in cell wall biosynthesis